MTTIESLKKTRGSVKRDFTTLKKEWAEFITEWNTKKVYPPLASCETFLEELKTNRKKYDDVHASIVDLVDEDTPILDDASEYMKNYLELLREIKTRISKWAEHYTDEARKAADEKEKDQQQIIQDRLDKQLQESLKIMAGTHPLCVDSKVNLPKLEIPTFDGDFLKWPQFHALFVSAVHSKKIPNTHKLQILISKLTDNAEVFVHGMEITDANYDIAWLTLTKHYENSRALKTAHLDKLFNIPKLQSENAIDLQNFIDSGTRVLKQINNLKVTMDEIFIHVLARKLDSTTRRAWEVEIKKDNNPGLDQFLDFLEGEARALAMTNSSPKDKQKPKANLHKANPHTSKPHYHNPANSAKPKHVHVATSAKCKVCQKEDHLIIHCPLFKSMNTKERRNAIATNKLCFNCFSSSHQATKCPSSKRCKSCSGPHHTLLHNDVKPKPNEESTPSRPPSSSTDDTDATVCTVSSDANALLATAIVSVKDHRNRLVQCRALVDQGSQVNFMTESMASRLGLQRQSSALNFRGVGKSSSRSNSSISFCLYSTYEAFSISASAHIVDSITGSLPSYPCPKEKWSFVNGLDLADPDFHTPKEIDLLLSANVYAHILRSGLKRGSKPTPVAQETALGWIIFGGVPYSEANAVVCTVHLEETQDILERFWKIEEVGPDDDQSHDEICEKHFQSTVSRGEDGQYMVRLPIKPKAPELGHSCSIAQNRFEMVERRLKKNPDLMRQYCDFMSEYISLGHMTKIDVTTDQCTPTYYLPHHAVIKKDSATTKCRVVFDASAKSRNGVSLNDILLAGPTIQEDIFSLLSRFRLHIVALAADITKMYRGFLVHPNDRPLQRIVWRFPTEPEHGVYQLNTITYGTASAPFQAIRCLQQLALDEAPNYPVASRVTLSDFYVDNLLTGFPTEEEASAAQQQLVQLMTAGKLELRQWASNSETVMSSIPEELRDTSSDVDFNSNNPVPSVSTLGIKWKPKEDCFTYKFNVIGEARTKREVLSAIARIFDPLGWLAPVIVLAKLYMKTLWSLKLEWDDEVPHSVLKEWQVIESQLPELRQIKIPRCVIRRNPLSYELHGFGDASKAAYGAVVYLKTTYDDQSSLVQLLCSKTRVSPSKELTIPKLELCAALLLSNLVLALLKSLRLEFESIHLWSDSSVTLCWLRDAPSKWKPFVANRVRKILDALPTATWSHVPGIENPADFASRGMLPIKLMACQLWWDAPEWLHHLTMPSFQPPEVNEDEVMIEKKAKHKSEAVVMHSKVDTECLPSVSSYRKLLKIVGWCLRFGSNSRTQKVRRVLTNVLSLDEQNRAEAAIIKCTQAAAFKEDIAAIMKKKPLTKKSPLRSLNPFVDANGLLRVGGRLQKANLSHDQRNPVILPPVSVLTKLLIEEEHRRLLHGGTSLVLSSLHSRYWILNGRNAVRFVLRKCVTCFRQKAKVATQLMGDLPRSRVTPSPPFLHTGVDYAGPVDIADRRGRGAKHIKGYIVLFVCMATKAIHLELATDLTTVRFMDAFRRFIAVRGRPKEMVSDCGTNFQGAVNQMRDVFHLLKSSSNQLEADIAKEKITWKFNPAAAPSFGGLWEAGVKSVKYHLKRVLGLFILTYEDYLTVLKQIEGALNSRPLTAIPTESEDPEVLTPGHFLIGRPLHTTRPWN